MAAARFIGGESLEIHFVGYAVAISGNRLRVLFEAVAAHNAMEVAESGSEFDDGSDAPFIDAIDVMPTKERYNRSYRPYGYSSTCDCILTSTYSLVRNTEIR